MDLIPPNRFRKSCITNESHRFEAWLTPQVPKLIDQPKWFQRNMDTKICDAVLFIKKYGPLANLNQYEMIHLLEQSKDDLIPKVVKYRNHNESVDEFTTHVRRELE